MNGFAVIAGLSSKIQWFPRKPKDFESLRTRPFGGWTPKTSPGLGPSLGWSGSLELRLATKKSEIRKAQKLRFKVFFEEGGAAAAGRRSSGAARHLPLRQGLRPPFGD